MNYESTKILELGSCAFRQWRADSHCKFIHGYRLVAKFWFGCNELDGRNWVVDFGGLKELKQVLEKQFDHTLCVAADDPQLELLKQLHSTGVCDLRIMPKGVGIERTAEWCFDVADSHIRGLTNNRCWVEKVEVWEHEKNSAIVSYKQTSINDMHMSESTSVAALLPPVANVVAAPAPEIQQSISPGGLVDNTPLKREAKPAPLGNKVTSGFSNLFAGTSWGK
jgi:6-pyruvoyltetrahydropterin/6-carboxytetrahydropterin synthase